MKQRRIPERMCTGCSEHKPKRELLRVVRSPSGEIALDTTGKKPGRGAYVCNNLECLKKIRKSGRLDRIFSVKVPENVYDILEGEMTANDG